MFDVISRIPDESRAATQKAGARSSASSALYDQILRSVLLSLETPAANQAPAPQPMEGAPTLGLRTLEDVMMQRQFLCSLNDIDSALPFEQLALQQQPLAPAGEGESAATNELLQESLAPWELLLGRLTLQQRLAD